MAVKKIGKAKVDPETGLWGVETKPGLFFIMKQRLVEKRSDIKTSRAAYSKFSGKKPPSRRNPQKREAHFQQQKDLKAEGQKFLMLAYAEILKESFTDPVPLRKDRDTDHKSDWRYCLYQGIIYQFDRPGYRDERMVQEIQSLALNESLRAGKIQPS